MGLHILGGSQAPSVCADAVAIIGKDALPLLVKAEPGSGLALFPSEWGRRVDDGGVGKSQGGRPVGSVRPHCHGRGFFQQGGPQSSFFQQFLAAATRGASPGSTLPPGGTHPRTRCLTSSTCSEAGSVTQTSAANGSIGR